MTQHSAILEAPTLAEAMLLGHLAHECLGLPNARTYREIVEALAPLVPGLNARSIYKVVKGLRDKGYPVGTTSGGDEEDESRGDVPRGAFIPVTDEDWEVAEQNLRGRALKQLAGWRRFRQTRRDVRQRRLHLDFRAERDAYLVASGQATSASGEDGPGQGVFWNVAEGSRT